MNVLEFLEKITNFAVAYRLPKSDMGSGAGCRHNKKAFTFAYS